MPRTGVDYADYNITVYRDPCYYSCRYCWAWRVPVNSYRISHGKYGPLHEARRISRISGRKRVVVSFTSDPYPPQEGWLNRTRHVIEILRFFSDHIVMILTKNPVLAWKDRDIIVGNIPDKSNEAWIGTTITSADTYHSFSTQIEPNAPRTYLRLKALKTFQEQGGKVWVSIEPIIPVDHKDFYPETIVNEILELLDPEKIALIVLGRLNYINQIKKYMPVSLPSEEEAKQFYREHVPEAIDILKDHRISYHIKKELVRVLE